MWVQIWYDLDNVETFVNVMVPPEPSCWNVPKLGPLQHDAFMFPHYLAEQFQIIATGHQYLKTKLGPSQVSQHREAHQGENHVRLSCWVLVAANAGEWPASRESQEEHPPEVTDFYRQS